MHEPDIRQKFLINNAKASAKRKGIKLSEERKEHISSGTTIAMQREDVRRRQLEGRNKPEVKAKQKENLHLTCLAKKLHKELDEQLAIAIAKDL